MVLPIIAIWMLKDPVFQALNKFSDVGGTFKSRVG